MPKIVGQHNINSKAREYMGLLLYCCVKKMGGGYDARNEFRDYLHKLRP